MKHTNTILFFISVLLCASISLAAQEPLVLSVEKCRQMAVASSEQMQQAENDYEAARLSKREAFAAYLPKLEGSATGIYMTPDIDLMGTQLILKGTYMAGLSVQMPLFAGGSIVTANNMAALGIECAELMRRKTEAEIVTAAEQSYWSFISVRQKVQMLESCLELMDSINVSVKRSASNQMATDADLLSVEASLSDLRYQQSKCRSGLELCRIALCNAIGVDWDTQIIPTDTTECKVVLGEALSVDSLSEMQLLEKNLEVKRQEQKMAFADFLPTAGIGAGYIYAGNIKTKGTTEYNGQQMAYSQTFGEGMSYAMLSITIPIWDWGSTISKYKKSKIAVKNAELEVDRNRRLLELRVAQARANLSDALQRLESTELGELSAWENLRVMTNRYNVSMCTVSDLLDAHAKWQQAISNHVEASTEAHIFEAEYRLATGTVQDVR